MPNRHRTPLPLAECVAWIHHYSDERKFIDRVPAVVVQVSFRSLDQRRMEHVALNPFSFPIILSALA